MDTYTNNPAIQFGSWRILHLLILHPDPVYLVLLGEMLARSQIGFTLVQRVSAFASLTLSGFDQRDQHIEVNLASRFDMALIKPWIGMVNWGGLLIPQLASIGVPTIGIAADAGSGPESAIDLDTLFKAGAPWALTETQIAQRLSLGPIHDINTLWSRLS